MSVHPSETPISYLKKDAPFIALTVTFLGAAMLLGNKGKSAEYTMHLEPMPVAANQAAIAQEACVPAQAGLIIAAPYQGRDYQLRCPERMLAR